MAGKGSFAAAQQQLQRQQQQAQHQQAPKAQPATDVEIAFSGSGQQKWTRCSKSRGRAGVPGAHLHEVRGGGRQAQVARQLSFGIGAPGPLPPARPVRQQRPRRPSARAHHWARYIVCSLHTPGRLVTFGT